MLEKFLKKLYVGWYKPFNSIAITFDNACLNILPDHT